MTVFSDILMPDTASERLPVVMIHGGGHTGACYLLTVDNRPGWAPRFAAAASPTGKITLMTHSMSGALGWHLVESYRNLIDKLVAVAPAPPGNIQPEAKIVEQTEDEIVVETFGMERRFVRGKPFAVDGALVRHKTIGKATRFPEDAFDLYVAHFADLPPRLICERENIGGSQLRVENSRVFNVLSAIVFTGEHDTDHSKEVDGAIVDWRRDSGADVEFHWLPDYGIHGNGHMLMMEDNSDELADMIMDWVG